MLVSYNWLKEYLPGLKARPEEVAEKLSLHAFSVEKIWKMSDSLDGVVVGELVHIKKHPNADKLSVAKVDVGQDKPIQLIFGQMVKMQIGDKVPVALAPTTLPNGQKIEKTKLRGQMSEGMLCLDQELGFFEGGVSIRRFNAIIKNGLPIAKVLNLDDVIMEVEITTNRPDAMGMIGIAREVGAIFGVGLKIEESKLKSRGGKSVNVKVDAPKLCPRYIAVGMDEVKVQESPWWLQRKLIASGVRPINNIVDITNIVLLEYGQPCHAFDADKLEKGLVIRKAKKGEKILALDENTYKLSENILVIADAKKPVAIAGIMGGEKTGVTNKTTQIIYEIANFDAATVRKGEHELGLSSDSAVRFNKGLPVALPQYAAARLAELTQEITGGVVTGVIDKKAKAHKPIRVSISPKEVVDKIGVDVSIAQMKKYLTALGFKVSGSAKNWSITFPYWRDIEAGGVADIAEEVARMHGYYKLPSILPQDAPPDEPPDPQYAKEQRIKEILCGAGYTELYTYSFVSAKDLTQAGFDSGQTLALVNPLTSDLAYMRTWLGISILKAIEKNQDAQDVIKLFEFSREYHPHSNNLPDERQKLIAVCAGKEEQEGEQLYAVKGLAEHLAGVLGLPAVTFEKVGSIAAPWVKHYHPSRVLVCKAGHDILGVVGEIHPSLCKRFGIEKRVAFLEWEANAFLPLVGQGRSYTPPLPYPAVKRDLAFIVSKKAEYAELYKMIDKADPLVHEVELFDQYEGEGVAKGERSIAFHISYADPTRTLKAEEADKVHNKLIKKLKKQFKAKIRE